MSWTTTTLEHAPLDFVDGDRGKNYPKQNELLDEGFCLFLNAGNVTSDGFRFGNCQFVTEDKDNALRKGKLLRDDVVLTTRGTLGNVAHYSKNILFDHVRINSGMVIMRTDQSELRPRFLYYFLRSRIFQSQVKALRSGAAQPQLPIRDIKKIKISYPDLDEQDEILKIATTYDDLIENNRRRIALLEQSARELYREWFVRLRFPGHEHTKIIDGVPENWERKLITDVCDTIGGGTPSTKKPEYWEGGDVTWVIPTDVTRNSCLALLDSEKKITEAGLRGSSAKMVPPNTILMTSRASVGFFAMIDEEVCTNQGFINIVPHDDRGQMYLLHNLMNRVEEIRAHAGGSTYTEISKGKFRRLSIVMPPANLLSEFEDIAWGFLRQVRTLHAQSKKLAQARDLLLPRLMDGRISV